MASLDLRIDTPVAVHVTKAEPGVFRLGRIPELDGLRGAAILSVLIFHFVHQQGTAPSAPVLVVQRIWLMGWSGVDLFFVLSGFLIGSILLEVRNSPVYYKTFYLRRFFRIIPIYYLWILAYIVLVTAAGRAVQAHSNSGMLVRPGPAMYGYFLFLQNLIPHSFPGLAGAWFGVLWSLAVEEQFYLVSPFVVRNLSLERLRVVLICVIVGSPLLRMSLLWVAHANADLPKVLMPCRADSLAMGMLAALLWRTATFRTWSASNATTLYALFAAACLAVAALWKWGPQAGSPAMASIGYTCLAFFFVLTLLIALAKPSHLISRCARMRWLRELGRISYCVYIIHVAVLAVCHSLIRHARATTTDLPGVAVTLFAALATIAIGWISWKAFEGPLLRRGHRYSYFPNSVSA